MFHVQRICNLSVFALITVGGAHLQHRAAQCDVLRNRAMVVTLRKDRLAIIVIELNEIRGEREEITQWSMGFDNNRGSAAINKGV